MPEATRLLKYSPGGPWLRRQVRYTPHRDSEATNPAAGASSGPGPLWRHLATWVARQECFNVVFHGPDVCPSGCRGHWEQGKKHRAAAVEQASTTSGAVFLRQPRLLDPTECQRQSHAGCEVEGHRPKEAGRKSPSLRGRRAGQGAPRTNAAGKVNVTTLQETLL